MTNLLIFSTPLKLDPTILTTHDTTHPYSPVQLVLLMMRKGLLALRLTEPSSVHSVNNVTEALQRYMGGGGIIVQSGKTFESSLKTFITRKTSIVE